LAELPADTHARYLSRQVVIVGFGRVGKSIAQALDREQIPYVVAEQNREAVESLRERGVPAVWGDATEPEVLVQAHIKDARALVIATPETVHVRAMADVARTLNPQIQIIVRSHNVEEAALLEKEGTATVFVGETELGRAMVRHVLQFVEKPPGATEPRH
jgi:CPA2 family monovalent cation:H+ antiporter-2